MSESPLYFMVQSPTGKTHAINPKTEKTYCGNDPEWPGWRSLDVVPSDRHKPTCLTCLNHYDDPIREHLQSVVQELKRSIDDFIDTRLILKDVDGIGRFVSVVSKFIQEEVAKTQKRAES